MIVYESDVFDVGVNDPEIQAHFNGLLNESFMETTRMEERREKRKAFEVARARQQQTRLSLPLISRAFRSRYSPNECQRAGKR